VWGVFGKRDESAAITYNHAPAAQRQNNAAHTLQRARIDKQQNKEQKFKHRKV
jgi:hypothetical protein